jgi:hypothetical protein
MPCCKSSAALASSNNVRKVLWTCDEQGLDPKVSNGGAGPLSLRSPEFPALHPEHNSAVADTGLLADAVLGLPTHRWYATPMPQPALRTVARCCDRLYEPPACLRHGRNGLP